VNTDVNPGSTHITYYTYDRNGMAKVISNYAGDLPRVDVDGVETTVPVRTLGASFGYTIDEINASKLVGKSLDHMRATTCRRAIEELMNKISYLGDAKSGLLGLFTHPNIPVGNAPAGVSGNTEWENKTPAEIVADINLIFRTVFETTKMVERPDTLLLTPKNWSLIMETKFSDSSDVSIAKWFATNSPWIKSIDAFVPVIELEGAGTGGVDVAVAYTNRADKLQIEIPQDVFFHVAEKRSLEYVTDATARFAGLNVYYPLSVYILEDV